MNKLTKTLLTILPVGLLAVPSIASAQFENIDNLIGATQNIVNALIPLVAAIALLAFFWGLAKYVFQADDEEAKQKGKNIMIGGIVALFLIAAVGGIIQFIVEAFGLEGAGAIDPTDIETNPNPS